MDWLLVVLAIICCIVGVIGSILPGVPGTPISYVGFLCFHFSAPSNHLAWWMHLVFTVLIIGVLILDYVIPIVGTKKFGGSKYGTWGSTIGLIVGLFFGIYGVIIGPFLGAFVFELIYKKDTTQAFKSALGSFVGFLLSTGIKTILALVMLGIILAKSFTFVAHKMG
jgi:uncharacterized protein YqgC (DUF456 family)